MVSIIQNRNGNYITFKYVCSVLLKKEKKEESDIQPLLFLLFIDHNNIHMMRKI